MTNKTYMKKFNYIFSKKVFFFISFFFFMFFSIQKIKAQENDNLTDENGTLLPGIILEGDTFAIIQLETVQIISNMKFASVKQRENWERLRYNVKKAYPFAIIASARLREYENILQKLPNDNTREIYMKIAEDKLKKEFEGQLKELTIKQGRILIKLIDRETGRTSYQLVKQLRGSFSAFMWQGLASIFGSSLKSEYDGKGEDLLIETAISQIEAGQY
jgi:hypothetical protein